MPLHRGTGLDPDVVTIPQTGETLTEGQFRERYPRGLLTLRAWYGDAPPTGDEAV